MAKKQALTPELTPAEQARAKADQIVQLEASKKDLETKIAQLKDELTDYVEQTGERDLGSLVAEPRNAKPTIDFGIMSPKAKKFALEQLMKELPEFVEQSQDLNVEKMYFALSTTPAVVNSLKVRGLSIVQKQTWAFKKAQEAA